MNLTFIRTIHDLVLVISKRERELFDCFIDLYGILLKLTNPMVGFVKILKIYLSI